MRQFLLFLVFAGLGLHIQAQEIHKIHGTIRDAVTLERLYSVAVVSADREAMVVTDGMGDFTIRAAIGDTLVISRTGYAFAYHHVTSKDSIQVQLEEQNYLLNEVSVLAYRLSSNEPRAVDVAEPARPSGSQIQMPQSVTPTIANPVDYLYDQFGRRPRQIRELQRILASEQYRERLGQSHNRQALYELTKLEPDQVEAFLLFCHYDQAQIRHASDYELLVSLIICYQSYLEVQAAETESAPAEGDR